MQGTPSCDFHEGKPKGSQPVGGLKKTPTCGLIRCFTFMLTRASPSCPVVLCFLFFGEGFPFKVNQPEKDALFCHGHWASKSQSSAGFSGCPGCHHDDSADSRCPAMRRCAFGETLSQLQVRGGANKSDPDPWSLHMGCVCVCVSLHDRLHKSLSWLLDTRIEA